MLLGTIGGGNTTIVAVGVTVCDGVWEGVLVGVPVFVGVVVGVFVGDIVGVDVTFGVGVGVISTVSKYTQPCVSSILITKFCWSYGAGTSKTNGNVATVDTNTHEALSASQ